jgi:hypothetical protein
MGLEIITKFAYSFLPPLLIQFIHRAQFGAPHKHGIFLFTSSISTAKCKFVVNLKIIIILVKKVTLVVVCELESEFIVGNR